MSNNIYNPGLYHVGSYQASGRPFGATGSLSSGTSSIDFPEVTKQIVVLNRDSSNDIYAYFHTDSTDSNKYSIAAGEQATFEVKCNMIILSSSATADYTLYASLTNIKAAYMYELTGSGVTE